MLSASGVEEQAAQSHFGAQNADSNAKSFDAHVLSQDSGQIPAHKNTSLGEKDLGAKYGGKSGAAGKHKTSNKRGMKAHGVSLGAAGI